MNVRFSQSQIALAISAALGAVAMGTMPGTAHADKDGDRDDGKRNGTYVSGDFHNHTTCSDGSISMQKLVKKATDTVETPWGLDWFVQAGHGNSGSTRNCTLVEDDTLSTPAYPRLQSITLSNGTVVSTSPIVPPNNGSVSGPGVGPWTTWANSIEASNVKGDGNGAGGAASMWRWQSVQEYQYPLIEYLNAFLNRPLFIGLESIVAGHEHSSMSVITGQIPRTLDAAALPNVPGPITARYTPIGNANALSQWAYCFDAGVTDTSRGNVTDLAAPGRKGPGSGIGNNWDCANPASAGSIDPATGWSDLAKKLIQPGGAGTGTKGHAKTVEAMKWMVKNHPNGSYYVPAHLERAGPFNPNGNNGYNIEHLRDLNNAAPNIAFGMETQPGHGASDARGEYTVHRNNIGGVNTDSVGGTTYGGTGVYGAQIGGVWDALLGEGRNFWFFASSDWHNRGAFGPDDRRSSQDFFPGEYQRTYAMVRHGERHHHLQKQLRPQAIVDGLRTGNAFSASGQLIDRLAFVACADRSTHAAEAAAVDAALENNGPDSERCVTMGEKLVVRPGEDVAVAIVVRDPSGTSFSPYTFDNPSLAQVGIKQPLNMPELDHIDVIRGMVSGYKTPGSPDYSGQWPNDWIKNPNFANVPVGAKNPTAAVVKTFNDRTWEMLKHDREFKVMTFKIEKVKASQYIRLRGTNMPANVPFETDANGNPLADLATNAAAVNPTVSNPNSGDGQPAGANLKIPCKAVGSNEFDGCPSHLFVVNGQKMVSFDVAAWSDLWFYSNPIYIEVKGSTVVAGVK